MNDQVAFPKSHCDDQFLMIKFEPVLGHWTTLLMLIGPCLQLSLNSQLSILPGLYLLFSLLSSLVHQFPQRLSAPLPDRLLNPP